MTNFHHNYQNIPYERQKNDKDSHRSKSPIHPSNTDFTPENSHILLGPIKMILSLWELHFSSRDHRFLKKVGIIEKIEKLRSLVTYEKASNKYAISSAILLNFKKCYHDHFRVVEKWSLWSVNYVRAGLLSGDISTKSVLLHLLQIPSNFLTRNERTYLGLDRNFLELCSDLSVSEVSLLHLKCVIMISNKEEEEKNKMDSKASEDAALAILVEEEMVSSLLLHLLYPTITLQ